MSNLTNKQGRKQNQHLFKPGQSGNPAGRPAGSKNKTTRMKEGMEADWLSFLMDEDPDTEDRKKRWEVLMDQAYQLAKKGDTKAMNLLLGEAHKELRSFNNRQAKTDQGPRNVKVNIKTTAPLIVQEPEAIEGEFETIEET